MIEVLSIFFQFFIFLIIFSFPFTTKTLNNNFSQKQNFFNFVDAHSINIIFFIYICLITSFLNFDLKLFFKIYFLLSIIFILFNYKNSILKFNNDLFKIFLVFLLINISIFFYIAQNLKLGWDGLHWIEKAFIFFNNENIQKLPEVSVHPHYPHLGSYLWAFFWKNSFSELEYFGRFFYVYFYAVSIFLIVNSLKLKNKFLELSIILFFILVTFDPNLFAGYQEYLIFSSLIFASRYILMINFENKINYKFVFLIILTLYTNCWFKDEGLVYFLLFGITFVLLLNIPSSSKIFLTIFTISLFIFQYLLQKYVIGIFDFPQKIPLSLIFSDLINIKILFTKISKILIHSLIAFVKYPLWIIVLLSVIFHFFIIKKFDKKVKYFLVCLSLNLLFVFTIFFTFRSFDFMLKVSLDRIFFQTSGFYIVLILLSLKNVKLLKK